MTSSVKLYKCATKNEDSLTTTAHATTHVARHTRKNNSLEKVDQQSFQAIKARVDTCDEVECFHFNRFIVLLNTLLGAGISTFGIFPGC